MIAGRFARTIAIVLVAAAATTGLAWYFYDPPWAGAVTSGLNRWEADANGRRFRWTLGRASFYVPRDASVMKLPLRGAFPGPGGGPVRVTIAVDDRQLTEVTLDNPESWVTPALPLPARRTARRFRRVDLHVNRTVGDLARGVQVGEIQLD